MNKKLKIAIVVMVIAIALFYLYNKYQPLKKADDGTGKTPYVPGTTPKTPPVATKANDDFPLIKGSNGPNVKYVQNAINKINPQAHLTADGAFGDQTYSALITYVGTRFYPVTEDLFTQLLQQANAS